MTTKDLAAELPAAVSETKQDWTENDQSQLEKKLC